MHARLRISVDGTDDEPHRDLTLLFNTAPSGDTGAYNKRLDFCNDTHLLDIELAYVEANVRVMDETLRQRSVSCLSSKGYGYTGTGPDRR